MAYGLRGCRLRLFPHRATLQAIRCANLQKDSLWVYNLLMRTATNAQGNDWRDGFLFLGDQLALDFLNTCPVQKEGAIELLSDFTAVLRWFHAAGLLNSGKTTNLIERWRDSKDARKFVGALRQFREKLRKDVLAWEHGEGIPASAVKELNGLMARYPMRERLQPKTSSTELYFEPQKPEDFFAPLAHAGAALFASSDRTRVRKCAHCVLHFLDVSKKGNRRWCSMQLCGNRQKVAAYAARQRRQHMN
jgi:predicted RNA-binding Zn ribbon-like protein